MMSAVEDDPLAIYERENNEIEDDKSEEEKEKLNVLKHKKFFVILLKLQNGVIMEKLLQKVIFLQFAKEKEKLVESILLQKNHYIGFM